MRSAIFITLFFIAILATPLYSKTDSILVGVEYFSGWWQESPNKWEFQGVDWRSDYPDRIPLLGQYNDQQTMDREIKAAAEHGIDFFSVLWYYDGNVTGDDKVQCEMLNSGLEFFQRSPHSHLMRFMLEITNHPPFAIISDDDWEKSMDEWVAAMKHPSYLKIDGRAVIKIHAGYSFFTDLGRDITRSRQILVKLREKAAQAGVGDLLIAVGLGGKEPPLTETDFFSLIGEFDCTMQYMDVPDFAQSETDYPYEELVNLARQTRENREQDDLRSVPYLPVGWNPRPWRDKRASFQPPTKKEWKRALKELKTDLIQSTNLGFPNRDGSTCKAFTIYAWNEFGEGGYLAPTEGDGYQKLKAVKRIFN